MIQNTHFWAHSGDLKSVRTKSVFGGLPGETCVRAALWAHLPQQCTLGNRLSSRGWPGGGEALGAALPPARWERRTRRHLSSPMLSEDGPSLTPGERRGSAHPVAQCLVLRTTCGELVPQVAASCRHGPTGVPDFVPTTPEEKRAITPSRCDPQQKTIQSALLRCPVLSSC